MIGRRIILFLGLSLAFSMPQAQAQTDEVQQLLLNVEKLEQLREMLDNMRSKYQIISQGYSQIKGIAEGNFKLHQAFLDRLVQVNPTVKGYYKVGEIIDLQVRMIQHLAQAKREFRMADFLREQEFGQIDRLLSTWSRSSLDLLEELFLILSDNELQMEDWERIQAIDRVHLSVLEMRKGIVLFSQSIKQLGELRSANSKEILTLQMILRNGD
mgnify:CR=1 FL=1